MTKTKRWQRVIAATLLAAGISITASADDRYNFNAEWKLSLGENAKGAEVKLDDAQWQTVTLPYAWNQSEAYSRNCSELSDTIMWYRKHFVAPKEWKNKRVFIEFEGVRFGAQVFINGHALGWGENGVMAFGFDLTPYIKFGKENVIAVFVDNDWRYHEKKPSYDANGKEYHSSFQWNDKNFFCNYGGINKNVWLHVMPKVYQTLPLYSNLGTTGVYVYATNHNIDKRSATINCEAQVVNSSNSVKTMQHQVILIDKDGKEIANVEGEKYTISAGDTVTLKTSFNAGDLHFWSWGYGYLYTVKSIIKDLDNKAEADVATIQTGFRKTDFKDGMFYLNDRVLQLKGFAQRSTNEWPALGISIPAWMSDYSNSQVLGCNGNFFRWMHVTPSKQDIRSFDRLGLIQAMPAGDAEKDVNDRRWQHRCEVMRDAIIYNRNNPSIIFYEGGNNQISEQHMSDLMAIRDQYDPHGGRAIGSRNMLDSKVAEYGGEMLYVNKSAGKPMWQMEYDRDEGIRRYWDQWSYPYHKEGEGPLYRGSHAVAYNHNQDGLAIENIVRWNEYWMARPGTGKRVNSGGAKIIFSDSNTHARGEKNYRTSGDMDAMRIPKDSWFVHQALWDGWVDTEKDHTYIIGHWNYEGIDFEKLADHSVKEVLSEKNSSAPVAANVVISHTQKWIYVASTGDEVELFLNGKSQGKGERSNTFLFTFKNVKYEPGTLRAVSYKEGKEVSSHEIKTVGEPVALRMHWVEAPETMRADGADIRIAEIEAVDAQGVRHPLAHDMIHFEVEGDGTYLGGVNAIVTAEEKQRNANAKPQGQEGIISEGGHSNNDNGVGSKDLMLEAGVIRVLVRSTTKAGEIRLTATPTTVDMEDGTLAASTLKPVTISVKTTECPVKDGFYVSLPQGKTASTATLAQCTMLEADWAKQQPLYLKRGETPKGASYTQKFNTVDISSVEVAVNKDKAALMYDDNEDSKWSSDSKLDNSWVKVQLCKPAAISQVVMRMNNFRSTSYPLQIFAGDQLVWEGYTPKSLGDCYLSIANPVLAQEYTIRMIGEATVKEAFGSMTELAAKKNVSTKESKSNILSIIEMSFNETAK